MLLPDGTTQVDPAGDLGALLLVTSSDGSIPPADGAADPAADASSLFPLPAGDAAGDAADADMLELLASMVAAAQQVAPLPVVPPEADPAALAAGPAIDVPAGWQPAASPLDPAISTALAASADVPLPSASTPSPRAMAAPASGKQPTLSGTVAPQADPAAAIQPDALVAALPVASAPAAVAAPPTEVHTPVGPVSGDPSAPPVPDGQPVVAVASAVTAASRAPAPLATPEPDLAEQDDAGLVTQLATTTLQPGVVPTASRRTHLAGEAKQAASASPAGDAMAQLQALNSGDGRPGVASVVRTAEASARPAAPAPEADAPAAWTAEPPVAAPVVLPADEHGGSTPSIQARDIAAAQAEPLQATDKGGASNLAQDAFGDLGTSQRSGPVGASARAEQPSAPRSEPNPMERAVANQVSRAIIQHLPDGGTRMVMRLTPPELGTVRVEFIIRDGVMSARLLAEDDGVRQALDRALPQIRSDVRTEHPTLDITVDRSDQRQSWQDSQTRQDHRGEQQGGTQQRRREGDEIFTLDGAEPVAVAQPQRAERTLGGRVGSRSVDAFA